ncbi:hypothetical protein K4A07_18460, partial [Lactiplantibacillus plantarum]|nr:hypothetical protein [Lactiplantibacillus plantarum]
LVGAAFAFLRPPGLESLALSIAVSTAVLAFLGAGRSWLKIAPVTATIVIAGGAGIVVLEEYDRARARGATIYAEVTGYGANADGYDMVAPSGEGARRCMKIALEQAGNPKIDYLN